MKTITRKYIMDHRTERGAWTRPQIEALGIAWPPRQGWINRVIDRPISDHNATIFESKVGIKQFRMKQRQGGFEGKKQEALRKYTERKASEELDREALNDLNKFI